MEKEEEVVEGEMSNVWMFRDGMTLMETAATSMRYLLISATSSARNMRMMDTLPMRLAVSVAVALLVVKEAEAETETEAAAVKMVSVSDSVHTVSARACLYLLLSVIYCNFYSLRLAALV
jgi:hypothetical protein